MRILQVSPGYYPSIGGVERHVQALAEGLVGAGYEVVVATMAAPGRLPAVEVLHGVSVRRFPCVGSGEAYKVPVGLVSFLRSHRDYFDVVHAHNYHALPLMLAVLAFGSRTVISPYYHGRAHSRVADVLHLVYDPFASRVVRMAGKVICLSRGEAADVVQRLGLRPEHVVVVPSGPSMRWDGGQRGAVREPLLLSVGRLEAYKRVDRLISALRYLPPQYSLVVVGDGPERRRLQRLAESLRLAERTRFVGRVDDADLRRWYGRARVVVSLSEAESFGISLLDGLACGCRVVCSDIPAFCDLAADSPDAVSVVPPWVSDPALARVVRRAVEQAPPGSLNLARYSWPIVVTQLLEAYQSGARSGAIGTTTSPARVRLG